MRRSVIIDGRLIGYRRGGIASYARQLAEHAPGLAYDLEIRIASRRPVPRLLDRTVNVITPPHHRLERYSFRLEVLLHRPDLLHSVDFIQSNVPGVRSVITVHDLAFLENPDFVTPESYAYYRQIRETGTLANRVIVVSESTRLKLLELTEIDPGRVRVVPNGFDPECFHPLPDNDLERLGMLHPQLRELHPGERPIVLFVGTIEPRKRLEILLRAFGDHSEVMRRLCGTWPVLVVVGQIGWMSDDVVARLRTLHHKGDAVWLRDVSDRDLAALYRTSSLLAMPSADEGFGLPVLEAMACGTTSLVANVGALPGLVADAGFIEDSTNAEQWAQKIGQVLADDEIRTRRSRRGPELAAGFTWRSTALKTVDVYREALSDK